MFDVIIPTYKCNPAFLKEAIDSVLTQTYQNFEIYISDGTPVEHELNSKKILSEYTDSRINIVQQVGTGISDARNQALAQGRNPYVCTLDADDVWDTRKLAYYKSIIEKSEGVKMIWGAAVSKIGGEQGVEHRAGYFEDWERTRPEHRWLRLYWCPIMTSTILYERESVERFGGWNNYMTMGEDMQLNWTFMWHYPKLCIQAPAYVGLYRHHEGSTMQGAESGHTVKNPAVIPNNRRFSSDAMFQSLKNSVRYNPTPYWTKYWIWLEQALNGMRASSNSEMINNKRTSPLHILQRVDRQPNGTKFKEFPDFLKDLNF